jgi:hypothetical protein
MTATSTDAHSKRAHARLAPSAASRWWNCPGSVKATEGIETKSSFFADEGTAAHTLADLCLRTGHDADRFLGGCVDITTGEVFDVCSDAMKEKDGVFEIDEEMAGAVQEYLDEVRSIVDTGADEFEIEQRLDMTAIHPDLSGTGDLVCYKPETCKLVVCDFKYGKGVLVSPVENKQLLTYAVGAVRRFRNCGLDAIELVVVQPRAQGQTIKRWTIGGLDLLEWEADLEDAAKRTDAPDAPFKAGEWCRFCPIAATCKTNREAAAEAAQAEFSGEGTVVVRKPDEMTSGELAAVLRNATVLKNWFRAVEAHAHAEALAGRTPDGFKLVPKRPTRKWKDEAEAELTLTVLGADPFEKKLLSPAKAEKALGKANKAELADLIIPVSSGTNLVPVEDERPSAVQSADQEFGG